VVCCTNIYVSARLVKRDNLASHPLLLLNQLLLLLLLKLLKLLFLPKYALKMELLEIIALGSGQSRSWCCLHHRHC